MDLNSKLLDSASWGDVDMVEQFLSQGADVNFADKEGVTAMMLASCYGHVEVMSCLFANGANIHAKTRDGSTALIKAAKLGVETAVEFLLERGASLSEKTRGHMTALAWAKREGHSKCEAMLSEAERIENVEQTERRRLSSLSSAPGESLFVRSETVTSSANNITLRCRSIDSTASTCCPALQSQMLSVVNNSFSGVSPSRVSLDSTVNCSSSLSRHHATHHQASAFDSLARVQFLGAIRLPKNYTAEKSCERAMLEDCAPLMSSVTQMTAIVCECEAIARDRLLRVPDCRLTKDEAMAVAALTHSLFAASEAVDGVSDEFLANLNHLLLWRNNSTMPILRDFLVHAMKGLCLLPRVPRGSVVYYGVHSSALAIVKEKYTAGDTVYWNCFTRATTLLRKAQEATGGIGGIVFCITVQDGNAYDVTDFSQTSEEGDIILDPNAKFLVAEPAAISDSGDFFYVKLHQTSQSTGELIVGGDRSRHGVEDDGAGGHNASPLSAGDAVDGDWINRIVSGVEVPTIATTPKFSTRVSVALVRCCTSKPLTTRALLMIVDALEAKVVRSSKESALLEIKPEKRQSLPLRWNGLYEVVYQGRQHLQQV